MHVAASRMNFSLQKALRETALPRLPEAYERLLLDAALGDQTLFTRADEVEAAWTFVEPVVTGCTGAPVVEYAAGRGGRRRPTKLMAADGRKMGADKTVTNRGICLQSTKHIFCLN